MACCAHLCPGREVCQIGWGGRGCCGGIAVELEERMRAAEEKVRAVKKRTTDSSGCDTTVAWQAT